MPGLPKPDLIAAAANSWTSVADSFPMANFLKSKTNNAHGSAMACGSSFWALGQKLLGGIGAGQFSSIFQGGDERKACTLGYPAQVVWNSCGCFSAHSVLMATLSCAAHGMKVGYAAHAVGSPAHAVWLLGLSFSAHAFGNFFTPSLAMCQSATQPKLSKLWTASLSQPCTP